MFMFKGRSYQPAFLCTVVASFYLRFKNEFPALWIKLSPSKLHRGMVESSNNQSDTYVHHIHVSNCRNNEILQGAN